MSTVGLVLMQVSRQLTRPPSDDSRLCLRSQSWLKWPNWQCLAALKKYLFTRFCFELRKAQKSHSEAGNNIIAFLETDFLLLNIFVLEANQNRNNCLVSNFIDKLKSPTLFFHLVRTEKSAGNFNLSKKLLSRQLYLF